MNRNKAWDLLNSRLDKELSRYDQDDAPDTYPVISSDQLPADLNNLPDEDVRRLARNYVLRRLKEESEYEDLGSSHSARVNALTAMMKVLSDDSKESKTQVNIQVNVADQIRKAYE